MGVDCRPIDVHWGSEPFLVSLGDHVSLTNVAFVTHDGGVWVTRQETPDIDVIAPIRVGSNVFLGFGVVVLPGVTVGDNVVVGAGAVVSRDIPSNCVAAGIPARPIKSIDDYKSSCYQKSVYTKSMTDRRKRKFLMAHFAGKLGGTAQDNVSFASE